MVGFEALITLWCFILIPTVLFHDVFGEQERWTEI